MAVDRANRDALAEGLAAAMRDELGGVRLWETIDLIQSSRQSASIPDRYLDESLEAYSFRLRHKVSSPEKIPNFPGNWITLMHWEGYCRDIACLKSDLEPRAMADVTCAEPSIRFLPLHATALLLACAGSLFFGWWLLWTAWAISGSIGMLVLQVDGWRSDRERCDRLRYYPFATAEDWRANQNELEALRLPSYEAWRERHPADRGIVEHVVSALNWILIACIVALMFVWSVVAWPLYVFVFLIADMSRQSALPDNDRPPVAPE
jgi:hypothetical protein